MRPVYWKSIGGWQWQMVTVKISSSVLVNLQLLLNCRLATLFLEMNRDSISTGQNKQTLSFSLIALVCSSLYLFICEQWLGILIWASGSFVPQ